MRIRAFLKAKAILIGGQIALSLFILFLFSAMETSLYPAFFILFLMWFVTLLALGFEWFEKNSYLKMLSETLDHLTEKSLIASVIDPPQFEEGKLFFEALEKASKSMNDAIYGAKKQQIEYQEYVETWVHEIKVPITVLSLLCTNASIDFQGPMREEIEKVDGYVEQALYYARSSAVEKDYVIKTLSLEGLVKEALKKNASAFISKKATIELEPFDHLVATDSKWALFMLGQIFSNSLKYTVKPPIITIQASTSEQQVRLILSDNGIGIPEEDLQRVCLKGFTGENGRKFAKSTGMGLYLVKSLCEKLYIGFNIESKLGQGTTITLVFPKDHTRLLEK